MRLLRPSRPWFILVACAAAALVGLRPATMAQSRQAPIDLSKYLPDQFYDYSPPTASLMALPRGELESNGTIFQISEYLSLIGVPKAPDRPAFLGGIEVDEFVKAIHLLHFTQNGIGDGLAVYGVQFHYEDGSTAIDWLIYGTDLEDAWCRRHTPLGQRSRRAWVGMSRTTASFRTFLQIFHTEIQNPHPAKRLVSIDLLSAAQNSEPAVGGITLDILESGANAPSTDWNPIRISRPPVNLTENLTQRDVRLIDTSSKRPISGAEVQILVLAAGREVWLKGFRTDDDGRAKVSIPPAVERALALELLSGTHLPMRVPFPSLSSDPEASGQEAAAIFELESGAPIGGTVTDQLGAPIEGATIAISQIRQTPGGEFEERLLGVTTSGTDGQWRASCLGPSFQQVFLSVLADGFVPALYEQSGPDAGSPLLVSAEDLLAEKAQLQLEPSMDLHGQITKNGQPVENAQVSLIYGVPTNIASHKTATDAEGAFRFSGLESGQGYLFVESLEGASIVRPAQWYLGSAEVNVALEDGVARTGKVVDQSGSPVAGAYVFPLQWSEGPALSHVLETDAEGQFKWAHSPPGEIWAHTAMVGIRTSAPAPLTGPEESTTFQINLPIRPAGNRPLQSSPFRF